MRSSDSRPAPGLRTSLGPERTEFVLLAFEGPDPYSRAGGLGVRVTQLARSLAEMGYRTHQIFVGSPELPGYEEQAGGLLRLYRWCQWISRYYPHGVYEGENEKLYDFNETVPEFVAERIALPAVRAGRVVVVLAEEWHTAHAVCEISDRLWEAGIRRHALLVWNANNTMGFDRINWGRLGYVATLTTVSRYMKHVMWGRGVNPMVIPNGIAPEALAPVHPRQVAALRRGLAEGGGRVLLVKVGRFDPDKRWLMAVEAVAQLKAMGLAPRLVMRGGIEPHEYEVLGRARALGLTVMPVHQEGEPTAARLASLLASHPDVDVFNLKFFVPDPLLRALYRAADAVLANSGIEPFGLVGLEVMGAGGVAVTGATGEDYAVPYHNAVVLETDDPREIVHHVARLAEEPALGEALRRNGHETAARFAWPDVIAGMLDRLAFAARLQGVAWPAPAAASEGEGPERAREAAAAAEEAP
ncbi:MAG TPA: glycosyltransferase family 4 protein [Limnochordales bacterium]